VDPLRSLAVSAGMVVKVAEEGESPQRMSSGRSTRRVQRGPRGGGWFPGTGERVRGAELQLDWTSRRSARTETGIPPGESRREGSHLGARPGEPGAMDEGMGPPVIAGRIEELRPATEEGE